VQYTSARSGQATDLPFLLRLFAGMFLIFAVFGCGGSSPAPATSGGTPGGSGTPPPPFQSRPFPGDFFIRLSPQAGNGYAANAAYDPVLKEIFASDPNTNAVEVFSSVDAHKVGEIAVPGPAGLSFSPDYSKLVVGTVTPYVYLVDPVGLHVTAQIEIPISYLSITQYQATQLPVVPYAMADGTIMIGLGTAPNSSSASYTITEHLVRYDPKNGAFAPQDPGSGIIEALPARSLDGTSLFVLGVSNSSTTLFQYSSAAQAYINSSIPSLPSNLGLALAVNADGSEVAAVIGVLAPGQSTTQVNFYGPGMQPQGQYANALGSSGGVFSRDGKLFYLMLNNNRLVALDTQTAAPAGYLGAIVGASPTYSQLFDIDEKQHLFGASLFGGMFILNASQLQTSPPAALPDFTEPSTEGSLTVGSPAGGALDVFGPAPAGLGQSDGIDTSMEAYFGSLPASNDVVSQSASGSGGGNLLTATVPPSSTPGPVSVVLTDASNDVVFLPDDFTYGPQLLRIGPNAVSKIGGDPLTISAYGLGPVGGNLTGQIGIGATSVPVSSGVASPSASFYFPEQAVTVPAPAGTPGWADITISNVSGSNTIKRGVQYLSTKALVKAPAYDFAVYDSVRDRFYLTGSGNSVAVFDPNSKAFLPSLHSAAVSSSATLFGEALTPDASRLVVSDPKDQLVIVFDLVGGTSAGVEILLTIDPQLTLTDPMPVEVASNNRAFVSLTPCFANPLREINLTDLTVQSRADAASSCATYVPYPEFGGASADGSTILFAGNSGLEPPGPEFVWSYNASTDSFAGPLEIGDTPWVGGQPAADGDGKVIALSQGTLDQRMLPLVPLAVGGVDSRLNETGSLLYSVNTSIVISDTHNGRPLLSIGLPSNTGGAPAVNAYRPLAIDPTGKKILVATPLGVSYFELSVIPLAVGTLSPNQGPSGANIQIRGSGFVSGTTVQISSQNAKCTETDSETLSCTVPNVPPGSAPLRLVNPDGQTYLFENAFTAK
jgi:hypothetical protein